MHTWLATSPSQNLQSDHRVRAPTASRLNAARVAARHRTLHSRTQRVTTSATIPLRGCGAVALTLESERAHHGQGCKAALCARVAVAMRASWRGRSVQGLCNLMADGGSKFSSPPAVNWSRWRAETSLEIELEPDGATGGCSTPWLFNPVASYFLPFALRWILPSLLDLTTASVWRFLRL